MVRWTQVVQSGRSIRRIPPDWVFLRRHRLLMPAMMLGRLSVDEWKPIIASSIQFEKRTKRSLWGWTILLSSLPLALLIGIAALVFVYSAIWVPFLYFVLIFPLVYLVNRLAMPYMRRARLKADNESSLTVGKERLLNVLQKIQTTSLDSQGQVARTGNVYPTISERIMNLQSSTLG